MGKSAEIETCAPAVTLGALSRLGSLVVLLRPGQWVKNLFLYVPLFFAGEFFKSGKLVEITWGAAAFCLVASGVYILNDFRDIDKDRLHPVKRNRPLAAGRVSVFAAFILMSVCMGGGLVIGWFSGLKFLFILGLYLLLNVGYSFGLKNISILDIFILSAGFVLRIKAGGAIAMVGISQWLMVMVFLLALFLALAKRRDDIFVSQGSGKEMRVSMSGYNLDFLNVSLAIVSAIIIVAYLMYTLSPEVITRLGTYRLYYTGVFVVAGLMRYLQLVYIKEDTGSPTRILFTDHFIQVCIALWMLSFYCLLYYPNLHLFR
jgi:4-hydroxybenzoate polyprenyltransferase